MKKYYVRTMYASAIVEVDNEGIIAKTAPIWAQWRGKIFETFMVALKNQNPKATLLNEDDN